MADNQNNNMGLPEIHTMPAQFLTVTPSSPNSSLQEPKSNKKLFIIIGVVAVLILGGAGVAVWLTVRNTAPAANVNNQPIVNANVNLNSNTNAPAVNSPLVNQDIGACVYSDSNYKEMTTTRGEVPGTNFITTYNCTNDQVLVKVFKAGTADDIDKIITSENFSNYQPAGVGQENIYVTSDKMEYLWISSNYLLDFSSLLKPTAGEDLSAVVKRYLTTYSARPLSLFSAEKLATDPVARDTKRLTDVRLISSALQKFYGDLKAYPIADKITLGDSGYVALSGVNGFSQTTSGAVYLAIVPKDPQAGQNYLYSSVDGKDYTISFILEKGVENYPAGTFEINSSQVIKQVDETSNVEISSSIDTDSDGLTDVEETLLGTNPALADTDGDTYSDLSELESGYDPTQKGKKLVEGKMFTTYTDAVSKFSLKYPTAWTKTVNDQVAIFQAATGEFVQVIIQDNPQKLSARDWYLATLAGQAVDTTKVQPIIGVSFDAVTSLNGLNVYISKDDKIIVLSYNVGNLDKANFKTIFNLMIKSWKWL